jgi:hypothetical protein
MSHYAPQPISKNCRRQIAFRPKGPYLCLAQAEGLGTRPNSNPLGPTARPFMKPVNIQQMFGPSVLIIVGVNVFPGLQPGLGKHRALGPKTTYWTSLATRPHDHTTTRPHDQTTTSTIKHQPSTIKLRTIHYEVFRTSNPQSFLHR